MMNVLIVGADYYGQIGGKNTHIFMLKKGLEECGYSVQVLFPCRNISTKLIIGGGGKILDLFSVGILYRQFIIKRLFKNRIKKFLEKNRIDIINAEDIIAFFSVYELDNKLPIVLTVHGELAQEMESAGHIKYKFEKEQFLKMEKRAYEYADYIVTVDTRLKNHVESLAPATKSKLQIIQNFIDAESFKRKIDSLSKEETKGELRIDLNKKIILIPRRLVLKCGVIYAIKSAEIMKNTFNRNDLVFLVLGDGPEMKNLLDYIQENSLQNDVFLKGVVEYSKMIKYYKIADIVLVPSINVKGYKEATSLSVLEAMAAKVPVIASNIGGLAEIINNEVTGILVSEKSGEVIAQNIFKLLNDEKIKNKIVDDAFNYVLQNHSYKGATDKFIKIYKERIKKDGI